jgi:hypothetical protein
MIRRVRIEDGFDHPFRRNRVAKGREVTMTVFSQMIASREAKKTVMMVMAMFLTFRALLLRHCFEMTLRW